MWCWFQIEEVRTRSLFAKRGTAARYQAFTLVETLVATVVFTLILFVGITVLGQVSNTWRRSVQTVEAFQSARLSFDLMTRNLSQATLNTYLDYVDANNRFPSDTSPAYNQMPVRYARQSDLHFVCGLAGQGGLPGTPNTGSAIFFQMPAGHVRPPTGTTVSPYVGLEGALNTCGYFTEYGLDNTQPQHVASAPKYRYRLKQLLVPTEDNTIFANNSLTPPDPYRWFSDYTGSYAYPVAENVIAVILQPQDPEDPQPSDPLKLGTRYIYDSREGLRDNPQPVTASQLPPVIQATMIAIAEENAARMGNTATEPSQTRAALEGRFDDKDDKLDDFQEDLTAVITALNAANIPHRVFSTAVSVRESKWTKQ